MLKKGIVIVLVGTALIVWLLVKSASVTSHSPNITFSYSPLIDNLLCSSESKKRIKSEWHSELKIKLPWLQEAWNREGQALLTETVNEVKKPFTYAKTTVPVFLCADLPGFSMPIMIPVRMYLESAVHGKTWDRIEFIDMVYHELLHLYVEKALHWNLWTPLLKKYAHEDFNTKVHLHLFALQKSVYLNLHKKKEWDFIVYRIKKSAPHYIRALEIVEQEGYEPFVEELKR